mgnify:CR=1 FL=1
MSVNYTPEQVDLMKEQYTKNPTRETDCLQNKNRRRP